MNQTSTPFLKQGLGGVVGYHVSLTPGMLVTLKVIIKQLVASGTDTKILNRSRVQASAESLLFLYAFRVFILARGSIFEVFERLKS